MLWLQRALGAMGGVGRMQGSLPPQFLEFLLSWELSPLLCSRGTHLGLGPWPPYCPQNGQLGRETVLELGGGTARPSALPSAPLVNMHPTFSCPPSPGLVDSDLQLVPARC